MTAGSHQYELCSIRGYEMQSITVFIFSLMKQEKTGYVCL